jgi:hypothetical protein
MAWAIVRISLYAGMTMDSIMDELLPPDERTEGFASDVARSSLALARSSLVETMAEGDWILWITLSPIAIEVGMAPDGAPFETKIS